MTWPEQLERVRTLSELTWTFDAEDLAALRATLMRIDAVNLAFSEWQKNRDMALSLELIDALVDLDPQT